MASRRAVVAGLLAAAALPGAGRAAPRRKGVQAIAPFKTSPFPYRGQLPDGSGPFLDVNRNGRLGHTSPRGGIYWEDETYSDRSTLLAVPKHFDAGKPGVIVVFFHGNQATLARDVVKRQRVVAQVEGSGLNAVLVAPQFAVDALDSSAGSFWNAGVFGRYMAEAAGRLAAAVGTKSGTFESMPIVIAAYSGGYNPAAFVLANGDVDRRLAGVILLDAAFGEEDKFVRWIGGHVDDSFFASAYGESSASGNAGIASLLQARGIKATFGPPHRLDPGTVAFIPSHAAHDSFVTKAFVTNPLQWLLARIPGHSR